MPWKRIVSFDSELSAALEESDEKRSGGKSTSQSARNADDIAKLSEQALKGKIDLENLSPVDLIMLTKWMHLVSSSPSRM